MDEPGAGNGAYKNAADEALVRAFLVEVRDATPRELVRYALALQAWCTRDRQQSPVTPEAVAEALRQLRQVLEAEP